MSVKASIAESAKAEPVSSGLAPADPCAMVLFGAGGDLTRRLVVPALYNLMLTKRLPDNFALIGVDLAEGSVETWSKRLHDMLLTFVDNHSSEFDIEAIDENIWQSFVSRMVYLQGDMTKPELYQDIKRALDGAEHSHGTKGNAIFYFAIADRFFGTVVDQLGAAGLAEQPAGPNGKPQHWRRVVIEKAVWPRSRLGAGTERPDPEGPERGPDLPHRPFPRQGDRPEHHGVPLCQRLLRNDLEPRQHRSGADHRDGDGRGRGAG